MTENERKQIESELRAQGRSERDISQALRDKIKADLRDKEFALAALRTRVFELSAARDKASAYVDVVTEQVNQAARDLCAAADQKSAQHTEKIAENALYVEVFGEAPSTDDDASIDEKRTAFIKAIENRAAALNKFAEALGEATSATKAMSKVLGEVTHLHSQLRAA